MGPILGLVLGLIVVFGPLYAVTRYYEKRHPHATVGEVGPIIIGVYVLEILLLFALMAMGTGG